MSGEEKTRISRERLKRLKFQGEEMLKFFRSRRNKPVKRSETRFPDTERDMEEQVKARLGCEGGTRQV